MTEQGQGVLSPDDDFTKKGTLEILIGQVKKESEEKMGEVIAKMTDIKSEMDEIVKKKKEDTTSTIKSLNKEIEKQNKLLEKEEKDAQEVKRDANNIIEDATNVIEEAGKMTIEDDTEEQQLQQIIKEGKVIKKRMQDIQKKSKRNRTANKKRMG